MSQSVTRRRRRVRQALASPPLLDKGKYDHYSKTKLEAIEHLVSSSAATNMGTGGDSLQSAKTEEHQIRKAGGRPLSEGTGGGGSSEGGAQPASNVAMLHRLRKNAGDPSSRADALRFSPYMFFHGEDAAYDDALKSLMQQKIGLGALGSPGSPGRPSPMPGTDSEAVLNDNIFVDLNQDDFSGGKMTNTIDKVYTKQTLEHEARKANGLEAGDEDEIPENLVSFRKNLLRAVDYEYAKESGHLAIKSSTLKTLLRSTYDIENPAIVELFCRELDRGKDGYIQYQPLFKLFDNCINGEYKRETAEACCRVFDETESQAISAKQIKAFRGARPQDFRNGATAPMVKALLDVWVHVPGVTGTITWRQFETIIATNEALVNGFLEEIIRLILVKKYKHTREILIGQLNQQYQKALAMQQHHNAKRNPQMLPPIGK